jgi:hypothetical protein
VTGGQYFPFDQLDLTPNQPTFTYSPKTFLTLRYPIRLVLAAIQNQVSRLILGKERKASIRAQQKAENIETVSGNCRDRTRFTLPLPTDKLPSGR